MMNNWISRVISLVGNTPTEEIQIVIQDDQPPQTNPNAPKQQPKSLIRLTDIFKQRRLTKDQPPTVSNQSITVELRQEAYSTNSSRIVNNQQPSSIKLPNKSDVNTSKTSSLKLFHQEDQDDKRYPTLVQTWARIGSSRPELKNVAANISDSRGKFETDRDKLKEADIDRNKVALVTNGTPSLKKVTREVNSLRERIEFNAMREERQKILKQKKQEEEKLKKVKLADKKRLKQEEQARKLQETSDFLAAMTGIEPTKRVKQERHQEEDGLKNLELFQQMEEDGMTRKPVTGARIGLQQIVRPTDSIATSALVRMVLNFKFGPSLLAPETKRIPNTFDDPNTYTKTFHYLLSNECIADLHQRLNRVSPQGMTLVHVRNVQECPNGLVQLELQEDSSNQNTNILKSLSLSQFRLGLLTNQRKFSLDLYGVPSPRNRHSFAFLCMLKTPESKEQLNGNVRVVCSVKAYELELLLQSSKDVWFTDFQKLSTYVREYDAVSNLPYSQLAHLIYNPLMMDQEHRDLVLRREILQKILKQLQSKYNHVQFESIRQMALRKNGILLLQGPPGTGKTSTLMGLLSAQYEYMRATHDNRKILVCTPSNAAVDHITKRLRLEGLIGEDGASVHPKVLRTGVVDSTDPVVTEVSLSHICDKVVLAAQKQALRDFNMTQQDMKELSMQLQKDLRNIHSKRKKTPDAHSDKEWDEIIASKKAEIARTDALMFEFRKHKVISKMLYYQTERMLLKQADIILTTLSSSGTDKLDCIRGEVSCLIVDEAAQATEPNLLIALQNGVKKVMLVGDPYQLPSTTMSTDSSHTLFNRSLFERIIDSGVKPYFLSIQYRMTPTIRQFPSLRFYQDRLRDGEHISTRQTPKTIIDIVGSRHSSIFLDVRQGNEKMQANSYSNSEEAEMVVALLGKLMQSDVTVGVITPYQSQRKLICSKASSQLPAQQAKQVGSTLQVNTVDSFQGQERDIIIISTVRANQRGDIGFLKDERRVNVTLTRARFLLIVVGHADTLGSNETWDAYLTTQQQLRAYFTFNGSKDYDRLFINLQLDINPQVPSRHRYNNLSQDLRKAKRTEIRSQDFQRKKPKLQAIEQGEVSQQQVQNAKQDVKQQTEKDYSNTITPEPVAFKWQDDQQVVIEEQRKREELSLRYEQAERKIKQLEKSFLSGTTDNEFLRQLYSRQ